MKRLGPAVAAAGDTASETIRAYHESTKARFSRLSSNAKERARNHLFGTDGQMVHVYLGDVFVAGGRVLQGQDASKIYPRGAAGRAVVARTWVEISEWLVDPDEYEDHESRVYVNLARDNAVKSLLAGLESRRAE